MRPRRTGRARTAPAIAALVGVVLLAACTGPTPVSPDEAVPSPSSARSSDVDDGADEEGVESSSRALDDDAALEAAVAWRSERVECVDGGPVDAMHRVVDRRDDVLVVHAVCFLGAYQPTGRLLVFDGRLEEWPVEQWVDGAVVEQADVVGDVEAGPDGSLVNLQLARALADCGVLQEWVVEGQRFVLRSVREQPCGEEPVPVPPEEWPLVHER